MTTENLKPGARVLVAAEVAQCAGVRDGCTVVRLCGNQDFYPVWYRQWGHGGTASTALSQLVRWIKGKPVLPLATWIYWGGEACRLLRHGNGPESAIEQLKSGGYPQESNCVLCGEKLTGSLDWWSLDGVSGPCCSLRNGCQQKRQQKGGV